MPTISYDIIMSIALTNVTMLTPLCYTLLSSSYLQDFAVITTDFVYNPPFTHQNWRP